jgi:hypothetical protein
MLLKGTVDVVNRGVLGVLVLVCGVVFDFFALMLMLFFVVCFVGCGDFCGVVLGVGGIVMIFCVGFWRQGLVALVRVG